MTDDFDLVIYIKGDRKPTKIYTATLVIDYENGPEQGDYDLSVSDLYVDKNPVLGRDITFYYTIKNEGPTASEDVDYTVTYSDNKDYPESSNPYVLSRSTGIVAGSFSHSGFFTFNPYPNGAVSNIMGYFKVTIDNVPRDMDHTNNEAVLPVKIKKFRQA